MANETDLSTTVCFYLMCVIMFVGIPGNIMCIYIWTKGKMSSKLGCATYLKLLSVTDLFHLLVPGTEFLLYYTPFHTLDVRSLPVLCILLPTAYTGSLLLSVWLSVALTVERTFIVLFPHTFRHELGKKHVCAVFCIILLLDIALHIPTLTSHSNEYYCDYMFKTEFNIALFSDIRYLLVLTGLPLLILFICNSAMLITLYKARRIHEAANRRMKIVTLITIAAGTLHVLTVIPFALTQLRLFARSLEGLRSMLMIHVGNLCNYLNSGFHWIVYSLVGTDFRKDLKDLFKCDQRASIDNTPEQGERMT